MSGVSTPGSTVIITAGTSLVVEREIELPETVFGYPYKEHLIYLAVESYRAAQRRGTHKTKGRSEVKGSGRKPWRQKGTGRARVGALRGEGRRSRSLVPPSRPSPSRARGSRSSRPRGRRGQP